MWEIYPVFDLQVYIADGFYIQMCPLRAIPF